jgi:hypothetical protein
MNPSDLINTNVSSGRTVSAICVSVYQNAQRHIPSFLHSQKLCVLKLHTHVKPNCLEHLKYVLIFARSLEVHRDKILACNFLMADNLF